MDKAPLLKGSGLTHPYPSRSPTHRRGQSPAPHADTQLPLSWWELGGLLCIWPPHFQTSSHHGVFPETEPPIPRSPPLALHTSRFLWNPWSSPSSLLVLPPWNLFPAHQPGHLVHCRAGPGLGFCYLHLFLWKLPSLPIFPSFLPLHQPFFFPRPPSPSQLSFQRCCISFSPYLVQCDLTGWLKQHIGDRNMY